MLVIGAGAHGSDCEQLALNASQKKDRVETSSKSLTGRETDWRIDSVFLAWRHQNKANHQPDVSAASHLTKEEVDNTPHKTERWKLTTPTREECKMWNKKKKKTKRQRTEDEDETVAGDVDAWEALTLCDRTWIETNHHWGEIKRRGNYAEK